MSIKNVNTGKVIAMTSRLADSEMSRAFGLMFSKPSQAALVLKFSDEIIISLHMVFVFYPIDVLFVNSSMKIVDLIEDFRPFQTYTAKKKAIYAIELPVGTVKHSKTKIGHKIAFISIRAKGHVNGKSITITKAGRLL